MRGHSEPQANLHPTRVALDGRVDEFFDTGKVDDLVKLTSNFGAAHAKDGAGKINIFATGEFLVKTGANFEEGPDAAVDGGAARGGFGDLGEDFEEGGFPGAVAANDTDDFAATDFEGDIFKGPDGVFFVVRRAAAAFEAFEGGFYSGDEGVAQGVVALLGAADVVFLAEILYRNCDIRHKLYDVCEGFFSVAEEDGATDKDEQGNDGTDGEEEAGWLGVGELVAKEGPAEAFYDAGHGVEGQEPL